MDNNFRVSQGALQALDSAVVLSGDHFKLHFNTTLVPSVVERLSDAKQPVRNAARRFLLTLMQVSSPSTTPHLCLESQELGLMDLPPPTLLGFLIWDGFDGSPTSTHHSHKSWV
nr:clip-associated protein [Quercus suber]